MKIVVTLFVLTAGASTTPLAERIFGGHPTSIDKHPAIAVMELFFQNKWGIKCAGNIINNYNILSAAHCTAYWTSIPQTRWRAGTSFHKEGGVIYYTAKVLNHPGFDSSTIDNDISLFKLVKPITYTPVIQAIAIPSQGYEVPDQAEVVVAGWGMTNDTTFGSNILQELTLNNVNWEECKRRYDTRPPNDNTAIISKHMICAGILGEAGKSTCHGDSGGPEYYNNLLVGIVSWGQKCGSPYYPSVFTKVSAYSDWIHNNTVKSNI